MSEELKRICEKEKLSSEDISELLDIIRNAEREIVLLDDDGGYSDYYEWSEIDEELMALEDDVYFATERLKELAEC